MSLTIQFKLNGRDEQLDVESDETLQSALRWRCGLSSARSTCGIGICGACTVLVDGKAISSCLMLAALADGCEILTVEGLAERDPHDPVLEAFVSKNAFQCSYCTPGLVMATKALLEAHPEPDDVQVREYLGGNLCRCGSYYAIQEAVREASRRALTRSE